MFDPPPAPGHPGGMRVRVHARAGFRGEEEPRALVIGGERREVLDVSDRWRSPEGDYFQIRADDGHSYLLRLDRRENAWDLVRVIHQDA